MFHRLIHLLDLFLMLAEIEVQEGAQEIVLVHVLVLVPILALVLVLLQVLEFVLVQALVLALVWVPDLVLVKVLVLVP